MQTSADHRSRRRHVSRMTDEKGETWSPSGMSKVRSRSESLVADCSMHALHKHRKGTVTKGSLTSRWHLYLVLSSDVNDVRRPLHCFHSLQILVSVAIINTHCVSTCNCGITEHQWNRVINFSSTCLSWNLCPTTRTTSLWDSRCHPGDTLQHRVAAGRPYKATNSTQVSTWLSADQQARWSAELSGRTFMAVIENRRIERTFHRERRDKTRWRTISNWMYRLLCVV